MGLFYCSILLFHNMRLFCLLLSRLYKTLNLIWREIFIWNSTYFKSSFVCYWKDQSKSCGYSDLARDGDLWTFSSLSLFRYCKYHRHCGCCKYRRHCGCCTYHRYCGYFDIIDTFVVYCTFGYLRPLLMLGLIFGNTWKKTSAANKIAGINLFLPSICPSQKRDTNFRSNTKTFFSGENLGCRERGQIWGSNFGSISWIHICEYLSISNKSIWWDPFRHEKIFRSTDLQKVCSPMLTLKCALFQFLIKSILTFKKYWRNLCKSFRLRCWL